TIDVKPKRRDGYRKDCRHGFLSDAANGDAVVAPRRSWSQGSMIFSGRAFFNASDRASSPIDGAKPLVSQEGIEDADRSPGLRAVAHVGIKRIAAVEQKSERDT